MVRTAEGVSASCVGDSPLDVTQDSHGGIFHDVAQLGSGFEYVPRFQAESTLGVILEFRWDVNTLEIEKAAYLFGVDMACCLRLVGTGFPNGIAQDALG